MTSLRVVILFSIIQVIASLFGNIYFLNERGRAYEEYEMMNRNKQMYRETIELDDNVHSNWEGMRYSLEGEEYSMAKDAEDSMSCDPPTTVTTISTAINPKTLSTTPIPNTTSPCTNWSPCSAKCGGCGAQYRWCGKDREVQHCNIKPCINKKSKLFCCSPFSYVQKFKTGLCRRSRIHF